MKTAHGEPTWAPFLAALSDRSARQAEVIVRGFYAWLAEPVIGEVTIGSGCSSVLCHGLLFASYFGHNGTIWLNYEARCRPGWSAG